jgi:hypothetical protein
MVARRRVLVVSNYNTLKYPFSGLAYELCSIVAQCEGGDLLAPEAALPFKDGPSSNAFLWRELVRRGETRLRQVAGRPAAPIMQPAAVEREYDLMFYVCQFMSGLAELEQIAGWRERCRLKVAFVIESWSTLMERNRTNLRLLDAFDHVFVLNRASLVNLRRYTSAPCSFLPTASDALRFRPPVPAAERTIDVYSMGRRAPRTHELLCVMADRNEIFYVYDAWGNGAVLNWQESRALTRAYIQRCRYFIAYAPDIGNPLMKEQSGGEQSLATRYFEGAAGGSVMLGSAPACPEFDELFDWPDALIPISTEPEDMRGILAELDAQPSRLARIRTENVRQSLLRHDWAHRWSLVLDTLGLERSDALADRLARLDQAASLILQEESLRVAG